MVEFEPCPEPRGTDEETGTDSAVGWETIARQELGVTLHQQLRNVERHLNTIIASIRDEHAIDPETVHGFRTEVEQLENAVTYKLTQINELNQATEAEQLERMGHELLQQFHLLARDTRRELLLDQAQFSEAETAVAEAENLLHDCRERTNPERATAGPQNRETTGSSNSAEMGGRIER